MVLKVEFIFCRHSCRRKKNCLLWMNCWTSCCEKNRSNWSERKMRIRNSWNEKRMRNLDENMRNWRNWVCCRKSSDAKTRNSGEQRSWMDEDCYRKNWDVRTSNSDEKKNWMRVCCYKRNSGVKVWNSDERESWKCLDEWWLWGLRTLVWLPSRYELPLCSSVWNWSDL